MLPPANTLSTSDPAMQYTLLLVDDTPMNLGVLSAYLEQSGFRIVIARDGEGGIKRAQYVRPDIILLDVMMPPGIDGFETCRRLKADPTLREIPVIFMTALAGTEDKVRGFEAGAVDYVTKPLQQEEVLARVTTHLKIRDLTRSLQKRNRHLEASHLIGQRVTSILSLPVLLGAVVELIQARFGYYFVGIWLLNEAGTQLTLDAECGQDPSLSLGNDHILSPDDNYLITRACRTREVVVINDIAQDEKREMLRQLPGIRAELAIPLKSGTENLGALGLYSDQPNTFDLDEQIALQTMATQIAIAIRNARLYQLAENRMQELNALNKDLAELNASKDKFFAVVAHDLKSPFNALLGLSLLQSRASDDTPIDELRDTSQRIYNSARTAYDLLVNLLNWSRLQLGRMGYNPELVNVSDMAIYTARLFVETAASKKISIINAISAETHVYADENMLNMVLRNLISNALKFTPESGHVTLSTREIPQNFLEIWVQDDGRGMSEADLKKLFRLDKPHSTPGTAHEEGTGLGLILCQELAAKNGGRLWVESALGQGTIVKFTVPVADPSSGQE